MSLRAVRLSLDGTPSGTRLAYVTPDGEVLVMGYPQDDDDPSHSCDAMGCGSTGPHVIARGRFTND